MRKNPLPVVVLTIFLDMLGYGILIPVLPQLLANPASPSYLMGSSRFLSQGYVLLGILIAVFPLFQFIAAPILGQLSDRYGRKKVLLISLCGTSLSFILFALGVHLNSLPLLFFARALDGATGGSIAVAQAAIADVTRPENRTRNFGLIGAAFGLGFIIGPFIGGKLSDPALFRGFSAATPFWFAAGLSLVNFLLVLSRFDETHPGVKAGLRIDLLRSLSNVVKAFSLKGLRPLYATIFLFHCGFSFFTSFISVYLIFRFGFNQGRLGDFFAYVGLWVILTQGWLTRRVSRFASEPRVLKVSLIACGIGVLLYFLPRTPGQLFFVVPVFAVFNGLSQSNLVGFVSRSVDASIQGEILGINASIQALAQFIPPILAGFLAAKIRPSLPLLVSGLTIIAAGLTFHAFYRSTDVAEARSNQ